MHNTPERSHLGASGAELSDIAHTDMTRREFLATVTAGVVAGSSVDTAAAETRQGEMIYRTLGRTGEKVSAIGLGGYHIGEPKDEEEGIRLIRAAIDRGITFMDNCWDYHDGGSEVRMGKALRDGYRDKVFLMSKIDGRTKQSATKQLEESLRRLQTDHIDLMQHHEVIRIEDPDRIFLEDGANAALLEAQKAGKIRFIGFTGHKDPFVHLRTLELADQNEFRFDAVQMPLNVMDAHFRSFEKQVLPVLKDREIGVLGMKPLASGAIPRTGAVTAIECLHYALSLPTSVVITGMQDMKTLEQGLEAVRTFQPLNPEQIAALLAKTEQLARTGKHEGFKTRTDFDATARNPEWLG
jgi:aryl-alcohol dehydrogenase-like predicted oxidoreductase